MKNIKTILLYSGCPSRDGFPHRKGQDYLKGGDTAMKNRDRQRQNRRLKHKEQREERIDKKDFCGIKDLTAYNAVEQIRTNGKAPIQLR